MNWWPGTAQMKKDGLRLVQIGCTQVGDDFEINYTFDKDFVLTNLRITVKAGHGNSQRERRVLGSVCLRERDPRPVRHHGQRDQCRL